MLVQMVYASRPVQPFTSATLNTILATARKNNPAHGITGMLIYDHRYFLQAIEGDRSEVNSLMEQLIKDPRHKDFLLLRFGTCEQRVFPHWSMGYAPEVAITAPFLFKHGVSLDFNPYVLTEAKAIAILSDLGAMAQAEHALES